MTSPPTALGRLLTVVSWEGSAVRAYRRGGRGLENVLTADVLSALEALPRTHFLGEVLRSANWGEPTRLLGIIQELEAANVSIFPDAFALRPDAATHQKRLEVQPDARIDGTSNLLVIEAKRIKSSSFQLEQLARNVLVLLRDCGDRTPTLLLVLGREPPVSVQGRGRRSIEEAVELGLVSAYERIAGLDLSLDEVRRLYPKMIAWTTWQEIAGSIRRALDGYKNDDHSTEGSIRRIADQILNSIEWHKDA